MAVAGSILACGCLLVGVVTWRRFMHPADTYRWVEGPADAVVMFGGAGPRFEMARRLVEAHVADTLVISDPNDPGAAEGYTPFEVYCAGEYEFEAICFDPEPRTTRGESRYLAKLAEGRGWSHVVVVTTTEQAARAHMLIDRCWNGEVDMVVVDTDLNPVSRVIYEWAATTRAMVFRRGC